MNQRKFEISLWAALHQKYLLALQKLPDEQYHGLGHAIFNQVLAHLPDAPDVLDDVDDGDFFDVV